MMTTTQVMTTPRTLTIQRMNEHEYSKHSRRRKENENEKITRTSQRKKFEKKRRTWLVGTNNKGNLFSFLKKVRSSP
jgi:hypothetical protein